MRIALTGGSGFLGRPLVRLLIDAGHDLRVLSHRSLPQDDPRVVIVHGGLDHELALAALVDGVDAVIHVAGCVAAKDDATFDRVNRTGTERLLAACLGAGVERFLFVSSLAAREPQLSPYARSKRSAEASVAASGLAWDIVRPPAIYGPEDDAFLAILKPLSCRIALVPAGRQARASVIHVDDAAAALAAWLTVESSQRIYELDDGEGGRSMESLLTTASIAVSGQPPRVFLRPPVAALNLLAIAADLAARFTRRPPFLTRGKLAEARHADWSADGTAWQQHTGWRPAVDFTSGIVKAVAAYRQAGKL